MARLARPIARFLHVEAAGGILLVIAAAVALIWANSPWKASYETFWHTPIDIRVGPYEYDEDLLHVVNDALMAVFFFVVGLEIKRELVTGELRDRRNVALPALAALGGMVVPALIYAAFNSGGAGAGGWGIPMATDIAFALGVLALLGSRVPAPLKVFLLTLAIVDDIGSIVVIAVFYADDLEPWYLLLAAAIVALVVLMRRVHVRYPPLYVIAGGALWLAVYESGVHATIAGVVMGLLLPMPGGERLLDALHPWTSYVIVPVFALANAGITLTGEVVRDPSAVLIGVVAGLVVGKLVGVAGFGWLSVRLGLAALPSGVRWLEFVGVAALAGIGFTVSLFITSIAFDDVALQNEAKAGILAASVMAAGLGAAIVGLSERRRRSPGGEAAPRRAPLG